MQQKSKLAIIGLGYVGLPLALLADRKGYEVIGVDTDQEKVKLLLNKKSPVLDDSLEKQLIKSHIKFFTEPSQIREVETIIICVPTPVLDNYLPNLEPLKSACSEVAKYLQKGQLVIIESTVNPAVCEEVVLPILEETGLKGGGDFYLAHCPERINPADKKWTVENINRVVGGLEATSLQKATNIYKNLLNAEVKQMGSLKEAEAVKVVENAFRDINIAFVNELAISFSHLGIDIVNVIDGASTKPFAFMAHYPGCGVGGHCIPVDPYYLIEYAKTKGFSHRFLSLAREINNFMPDFTVGLILQKLKELDIPVGSAKVAVLGLAYKAQTDDCRESPSFEVISLLKGLGVTVSTYDPFVVDKSSHTALEAVLDGSDIVVVATAHDLFKTLTPALLEKHRVKGVVDGRNCLAKEKFVSSSVLYTGIGR
jgi:nucleotide sugar dehydrogenase